MAEPGHDHHRPVEHAQAKDGALDPVCGMTVDPATAKHRAEHGGGRRYAGRIARGTVRVGDEVIAQVQSIAPDATWEASFWIKPTGF